MRRQQRKRDSVSHNVYFALCCCCALLISSAGARLVSFTADGEWGTPTEPWKEACSRFMCTPSNLTWIPNYENTFYTSENACDALVKRGIKKIFFHGDSYMRQIYAALLITLNGDYEHGSQANPANSPQCTYHKQFNEKGCGTRQLNHYGRVCNDQVIVDPLLHGIENLNHCANEDGTVLLWSFGNYKVTRHGRNGVNNATLYQQFFEDGICPTLRAKAEGDEGQSVFSGEAGSDHRCSIWWVSTHYRLRAYFPDEVPEMVYDYNREMRAYFDHGDSSRSSSDSDRSVSSEGQRRNCGNINYIDVYNMTRSLAVHHQNEAEAMTYDQVHWGFEVNLIKAQIILNALLS